jgi:hypothetical protein
MDVSELGGVERFHGSASKTWCRAPKFTPFGFFTPVHGFIRRVARELPRIRFLYLLTVCRSGSRRVIIPVHLFLRITEKFGDEHPHVQSCADEGATFSQKSKKRGRIDVGRYSVQAQGVTSRRSIAR